MHCCRGWGRAGLCLFLVTGLTTCVSAHHGGLSLGVEPAPTGNAPWYRVHLHILAKNQQQHAPAAGAGVVTGKLKLVDGAARPACFGTADVLRSTCAAPPPLPNGPRCACSRRWLSGGCACVWLTRLTASVTCKRCGRGHTCWRVGPVGGALLPRKTRLCNE